jgi:phosphatidylinositol-bisphosphatase
VNQIVCRYYDRILDIRCSDHKPVVGIFDGVARVVVDEKRSVSYDKVTRALSKYGTDHAPEVEFDRNKIQFPLVFYRESVGKEFTLSNIGQAPAAWRVLRRPEGTFCNSWFSIEPLFGMLIPGESVRIRIKCFVGATSSRKLLNCSRRLDDLIVIRVEKDKDYFISLLGELTPTCFGNDLISLVSIPYPLRGCTKEEKDKIESKIGNNSPPLYIPKELWHLIDHLWKYNLLGTYGLLLVPGDADEMRVVRQCIDAELEIPIDRCTAHSIAAVLVEFLDALSTPVVPPEYFPKGIDFDNVTAEIQGWSSRFFRQLPSVNHNVLAYVIAFGRELLSKENAPYNRLTSSNLSPVLARILFRPEIAVEVARDKSAATGGIVGEFSNWLIGDTGLAKESSVTNIAESAVNYLLTVEQRYLL